MDKNANKLKLFLKLSTMKRIYLILIIILAFVSCTSQKKLAYLNNLSETGVDEYFKMEMPMYKIQPRDVLYITVMAMSPEGNISDFLSSGRGILTGATSQYESGQFLLGYDVNSEGYINIPVVGKIKVSGITLEEVKQKIQESVDKVFKNSTVECKLLSFKFTVIGEVKIPGTYINYNNYLTVIEAIGRAGGISDYGSRKEVLIVRPVNGGTKTFKLDLQDKKILSNEAYYLLPNDVIIIEPESKKIFNLNLPTFSFVLTSITSVITTALLLINYLGK